MAYTDFIAAVDLGSSQMIGIVGRKLGTGALSIIAYDSEDSSSCIQRSCVYNVEDTAAKVKQLILKLQNKVGNEIEKIYVGVGGQSLHTIDFVTTKALGPEGIVTEAIIKELLEECRKYKPELVDVLDIVSPSYYLDGKPNKNPVGVSCNRIEARYKLVVGRPSLRRLLINSITERAKSNIAGIVISPLALADVVLTNDEKELGCALIDFGAGVTSLSVFKDGLLVDMCVIPLGGILITHDIASCLHITESEAERIKNYASMSVPTNENNEKKTIKVMSADGSEMHDVQLSDLNNIVYARAKEILDNIFARLSETDVKDSLEAGIVITGGASELQNLQTTIQEMSRMKVRRGTIRKGIIYNDTVLANNPEFAVAIGLLMKGDINCAKYVPITEPEPEKPTSQDQQAPAAPKQNPQAPTKPKKKGFFSKFTKEVENFGGALFDDKTES